MLHDLFCFVFNFECCDKYRYKMFGAIPDKKPSVVNLTTYYGYWIVRIGCLVAQTMEPLLFVAEWWVATTIEPLCGAL